MEDKLFLLSKLEDDNVDLVLDEYNKYKNQYETAKAIVLTSLDDESISNESLGSTHNIFLKSKIRFGVIKDLVNELYSLHRKTIFEIKKRLVDEEREVDKQIVNKIRNDYEEKHDV